MKKASKLIPICLALLLSLLLFVSSAWNAEKTKISVQRFGVSKSLDPALGGFLYDILLERMVDSGKYTVVDWEELDRIQKYIADSQPNVSEKDAREQAGNQLGIEMIYVGSLKKVGSQYFISVKVLKLDLSVVDTENKFVKSEDDLWDGINKVADQLLGLSKEVSDAPETIHAQKGKLFVETEPKGARIRILNIKPKFYQGMELESGSYHVEVSASNYATQKVWFKLSSGEDKTLTFRLTEATASSLLQKAIGFYIGTAGRVNQEKARMSFIQAAEKNDPLARMWVARCYHKGRCGFPKNESRGEEIAETVIHKVKALAAYENTEAMFLLASAFNEGLAISEDHAQAVFWYRKAAERGHAVAMGNLASCYSEDEGVAKDDSKAVYWCRKAADKGNAFAMNSLGWKYERGKGVAKDYAQAVYWYRKAAEKGNLKAMTNLATKYYMGEGVARDYQQAFDWYQKAANKDDADAMVNLGIMYSEGRFVTKDETQAVYWYSKAAEKGSPQAMFHLAHHYQEGKGTSKDETEAAYWYKKAAGKGHADSMNNLGVMYFGGAGVSKDYAQAVYWYRKAAEKDSVVGMANLADAYEKGWGIIRDKYQAIYWYRKAAEKGFSPAQQKLKELGY